MIVFAVCWLLMGLWFCAFLNVHKWHEEDPEMVYPVLQMCLWGWPVMLLVAVVFLVDSIRRSKREKTKEK